MFTVVDRFTRWPVGIPIKNNSTETVVRALMQRWIALYGVRTIITTDRGTQFESSLFENLTNLLGATRLRTTAYHPQANGIVERFHRHLKSALKYQESQTNWHDALPLILLSIRTTVEADLGYSSAECVYGTTLALPGELIVHKENVNLDPTIYVDRLKQYMFQMLPALTRLANRQSFQY